jgi:hypothetical protein
LKNTGICKNFLFLLQIFQNMKLLTPATYFLILFSCSLMLSSCEEDAELKKTTDFSKNGIVMSGSQETPPNTASALGTLNVSYTKETRILTYSFDWSGLTGPVTAAHIHGLGPTGYVAPVVQTFTLSAITRCSGSGTTACGSYKGTFLVDGVVVKENDLLNGVYYVNIHTAAFPAGEIRGQIIFQ